MARVIVDFRESRSGLAKLLADMGAEVVVEELEAGDYMLAEGLGVERKAANDFVISILDKRIFSQVQMLKRTYARPFFVVEGDVYGTRSAMDVEALEGAMSYITVIEGIQVVHTRNTQQTASMLLRMRKHATEGLGYEIPLRGAKPKDRAPQAQYLVEGLPGIGPGTAKKLLAHFGSPHAIFTASPDALRQVPGIGAKTISAVREVLDFRNSGPH